MQQGLLAITGAAGRIGSAIRPFLRERYRLRLIDVRPVADLQTGETFVQADARDFAATEHALAGTDGVLHLAGEPSTGASWQQVRTHNIDGTFNVFEGARRGGARKIVFASTNHVKGFDYLERNLPVDDRSPIRPDSLYGVSKAFGEALGRYFSDAFGMSIICIRIGWFTPNAPDARVLNQLWISPRDLAQLFQLALETDRPFGIYNGTSANSGHHWDLRMAMTELGYAPRDDVADFAIPRTGEEPRYVDPRQGILN